MNPFDLLKNLQSIQESMQVVQDKMKTLTVTGAAGGDFVRVTIDGQMKVLKVELAKECIDPQDIPLLQDLIRMAVNDAFQKMRDKLKEEIGQLAPGVNFPTGFPGF